MRGSKRLRGKTWELTVVLGRDREGKPIREYRYLPPVNGKPLGRREADEELAKFVAEVSGRLVTDNNNMTVGQFLNKWLTEYVNRKRKPDTKTDYAMVCRLYLDSIGHIKLKQLRPLDVQTAINKVEDEVSAFAARKAHRTLKAALNMAVQWELIPTNPANKIAAPAKPEVEQSVMSSIGIPYFLAEADKLPPPYPTLFLMALHAGMRAGEILGLRWKDIDFDAGKISVVQALQKSGSKPEFKPVKSKKSKRIIPMTDRLRISLLAWRTEQKKRRLQAGELWEDYGLVFTTWNGRPLDKCHISQRHFKKLVAAARKAFEKDNPSFDVEEHIPADLRFHDLRHTFATELIRRGVPLKTVSELLGHSSISITADIYGHVTGPQKEAAALTMNEIGYADQLPIKNRQSANK